MKCFPVMLALLLALTAFFPLPARAEAEKEVRTVETAGDAEEWIRVLLGDAPEALKQEWKMTAKMKLALALSGGVEAMAASLTASLGTAESIGPAYEGTLGGYRVFYVPCVFSVQAVDLVLALEEGAVAGLSTHPYTGKRQDASSALYESLDLALPVPALDGALPGTLTLPKGEGPFPAAVLVHGSGPNDRDETVMDQKPFRDLAEGLAEKGIAVYRYDKRTLVYGAKMAADRGITLMDETVDDAAAAVQLLASQEKIDPDRIFVIGHSLGANAVPAIDRALQDLPVRACGYVLMAASPRPLQDLMREQYGFLFSLMPDPSPAQLAEKDRLFAELDRLQDLSALTEEDLVAGAYAPYWQWLASYDMAREAASITVPCLALQGEEDYQVTMEDFALLKKALADRGSWQFRSFPGLTHCFTPGLKAEGAAVYARQEKVDPQVISDIAFFLLGAE